MNKISSDIRKRINNFLEKTSAENSAIAASPAAQYLLSPKVERQELVKDYADYLKYNQANSLGAKIYNSAINRAYGGTLGGLGALAGGSYLLRNKQPLLGAALGAAGGLSLLYGITQANRADTIRNAAFDNYIKDKYSKKYPQLNG